MPTSRPDALPRVPPPPSCSPRARAPGCGRPCRRCCTRSPAAACSGTPCTRSPRSSPSTSSSSSGTARAGPRRASRRSAASSARPVDRRRAGAAARHRARRAVRARRAARRPHRRRCWSPTATCRCSTPPRCAALLAEHAAVGAAGHAAHQPRSPTPPATGGSCARPDGTVTRDRRAGRRDGRAARRPRDQLRHLRVRRRVPDRRPDRARRPTTPRASCTSPTSSAIAATTAGCRCAPCSAPTTGRSQRRQRPGAARRSCAPS